MGLIDVCIGKDGTGRQPSSHGLRGQVHEEEVLSVWQGFGFRVWGSGFICMYIYIWSIYIYIY